MYIHEFISKGAIHLVIRESTDIQDVSLDVYWII